MRKKIIIILIIIIVLLNSFVYAYEDEEVKFVNPEGIEIQDYVTYEEINGEKVRYPASTYGDLFLAYEDLNYTYEKAKETFREEIKYLEKEIEKLEKSETDLKLQNETILKEQEENKTEKNTDYIKNIIIVTEMAIIIYISIKNNKAKLKRV